MKVVIRESDNFGRNIIVSQRLFYNFFVIQKKILIVNRNIYFID